MSVRVRYAPSPTGSPHVGNIRTALFAYLFARHHNGTMMLRIEDTDRTRYVEGSEEYNIESLKWLGIEWQEGPDKGGPHAPYRQSERKEAGIYEDHIKILLEKGSAYWAFDTPAELEEMRDFQKINKQATGYYGGVWRDATPEQVEEARRQGKPGVVRLAMPKDKVIVVEDAVRGRIEFEPGTADDQVLIKGDGMPTYHFAAMVDDHLMGTTHIIRGEEWISSAPKHVWLFESFGWQPPVFVHVPVILGTDGKKLSKRHGDTQVLDYRAAGYLPEALDNFIALIGWAPGGDRELMTMDEMAEAFDLDGIQPSPGVFDLSKLNWMNGHYIRQTSPDRLVQLGVEYAKSDEAEAYWHHEDRVSEGRWEQLEKLAEGAEADPAYAAEAVKLEQERIQTLADLGPATEFFFVEEPVMDPKAVEKWFHQPHVPELFAYLIDQFGGDTNPQPASHPDAAQPDHAQANQATVEDCERMLREFAEKKGLDKLGPVVHPTRVALTGKTVGPGLFELMSVLGPERMVRRLKRAQGLLA